MFVDSEIAKSLKWYKYIEKLLLDSLNVFGQ